MNKLIYIFLITITFVMVSNVNAANQDARSTTITKMTTYVKFGNGDVIISASVSATNCSGFWLSPDDLGYKATLSTLLSAYHAKSTMNLGVEDTQVWTGSSSPFCRLVYVELL